MRRVGSVVALLLPVVVAAGCGLESLFFIRRFEATPPPHAVITGVVNDVGDALSGRLGGQTLTARAVAVDGRILASGNAKVGEGFTLDLPPNLGDQFNVRVIIGTGSAQLRTLAPEVPDGQGSENTVTNVGTVGLATTAAQLLLEAYTATARSGLSGTPPSIAARVLQNASDTSRAEVGAFHDVVRTILAVTNPASGQGAFGDQGGDPTDTALSNAGVTRVQWETLRDAAVAVVGVPVVCDPSRIKVMFTVDISGQALDGNGRKQFLRQAPKEGRVFLGITTDASSPVSDAARVLKTRLTPNDVDTEMVDDGTQGDEVASDQIFTATLTLPRGMRVIYKYTNGSPGEGYTGTEEWPGNARILEVVDAITGEANGDPDCLVLRRDSFGDESSNKNFVNLHANLAGGALRFDTDLGGAVAIAPPGDGKLPVGGLAVDALQETAPLTPAGIPEARENGVCLICPPPVTVPVDDNTPPSIINARFSSTEAVQVLFTEDLDLGSAAQRSNYLLVDDADVAVSIRKVEVSGALVALAVDPVDPRKTYRLFVARVADASLQRNPVADIPGGITVQQDTVAPTLVDAVSSTITEVNPAARPANPRQGEVVVLHFSEVLDRISAENTTGYALEGPQGALAVYAAFQRGKDVLLVTDSLTGGVDYTVAVTGVFDVAGNIISRDATATFKGLKLYKVTIHAVPGHAFKSVDGRERGLPNGAGLFVTGTIAQAARSVDGADIRVVGRPDVAGRLGYEMTPTAEVVSGKPVYRLELNLPVGTYSFKLAHGTPADAAHPPATLETVTKSLSTTNDATGVLVDPITLTGTDGLSYAGARLSLSGDDPPGPGVLFKRENPDEVVNVADADVVTPTFIIGTWRDVPFGAGRDYDDGKRDLALPQAGALDTLGPLPISADARDSESVLLSFDEAIGTNPADLTVSITDEAGVALPASVLVVALPRPNQAVLRTGPQALNRGYTVLITRAVDAGGRVAMEPRTVAFTSPGAFQPFTPVVDTDPPAITQVLPTSPTAITVRFSERVAATTADPARFSLSHRMGGMAPTVSAARITEAGRGIILTTSAQEILAPYALTATNVDDQATPPNRLLTQTVNFDGFGDSAPPELVWARPVTSELVLLKFNEALDASSAAAAASYTITGKHVMQTFSVNTFNLGDRLYRNHLSFIKDFAPEMGRGVRFGYTMQLF